MAIVKMIFGSHLYGTSTKNSDTDLKEVYLPTWEQITLGKIETRSVTSTGKNTSKNTSNDVDIEKMSLHKFIKLALEGQTMAFDMMHAPDNMLIVSSPIWEEIVKNKQKFYSKNINAFVGYVITQAAKYGIKGSRLDSAKCVLDWLEQQPKTEKIKNCDLKTFPLTEHSKLIINNPPEYFSVCGKKILLTFSVQYAYGIVSSFYDKYGERAKRASVNDGIDWKAISHAFRIANQVRELFTTGTMTMPRPEAKFLIEVKLGQHSYNDIIGKLENLVCEIKELRNKSDFPDYPDQEFWNNFITRIVEEYIIPYSIIRP